MMLKRYNSTHQETLTMRYDEYRYAWLPDAMTSSYNGKIMRKMSSMTASNRKNSRYTTFKSKSRCLTRLI